MLVLDRKIQEGFWIDGRIFIKVLSVGKRRVKLGIEAPSDLQIVREELRSALSEGPRRENAPSLPRQNNDGGDRSGQPP